MCHEHSCDMVKYKPNDPDQLTSIFRSLPVVKREVHSPQQCNLHAFDTVVSSAGNGGVIITTVLEQVILAILCTQITFKFEIKCTTVPITSGFGHC